ncbi:unnamed protein product [Cuscuta campestris]|uniref:Uncharacterized protein n=1 Tax=Cuscuta campestris TaxID=132261 RepID=A0A484KI26_9ASTE|nr:unnamed protein product [Cuscuta campestris]
MYSSLASKHLSANITPYPKLSFQIGTLEKSSPKMSLLLGPPEIYNSMPSARAGDASPAESGASDPFMDLMMKNFNAAGADFLGNPKLGQTAKGAPTYLSSGNPCLDFFFQAVSPIPVKSDHYDCWGSPTPTPATVNSVDDMLKRSWNQDPLTTLKLLCNLRGVGGTGKSDKEGFYAAALWLHSSHPKSLACNLEEIARFGYLKDFPEILYRLLEGGNVRERQKADRKLLTEMKKERKYISFGGKRKRKKKQMNKPRNPMTEEQKESRKLTVQKRTDDEKAAAKLRRDERRIQKAKKVIDRFKCDPDFRFLHDQVSDLFSKFLKRDLELLKQGPSPSNLSEAAKWCPSLDSSFDQATLLCETIARKIFPKEENPDYQGIEDAQYAYRVRDLLRKEVLVPLRKALQSPEIPKENTCVLLPHQIVKSLSDEDGGARADSRWSRMVKEIMGCSEGKKGMKNCLAICDVSSSMEGTPLEAGLALGLLVSELSEEPWKGKLITFSEKPQLHQIKGDNLLSKVGFAKNMKLVQTKDFQKVVDMILEVAVKGNLREDQMIKRLFVFTDMEFDQTPSFAKETDYQAIERKFREKGYWNCVPEIVFWNLKSSKSTPVLGNQKGAALVGGLSPGMMRVFLERDVLPNPLAVMESAISGDEYSNLVVID